MEDFKKKDNSRKRSVQKKHEEDMDDLDRFIEKRKIQNEALKKIAGIEAHSPEENEKHS